MGRIDDLADRDGWTCWLCGGELDRDAPANAPLAATIDHVVPKSRGGPTEPSNLRLSHRRCNGARGNHLPELSWPGELALIESAPVWQSLARIMREGSPEIVALAPTRATAEAARDWVTDAVERFVGGSWRATVDSVSSHTDACTVTLQVGVDPDITDVGRPL